MTSPSSARKNRTPAKKNTPVAAAQEMQEPQDENPVEAAGNKNNLVEEDSDRLVDSVEGPSSGSGKSDRLRRAL